MRLPGGVPVFAECRPGRAPEDVLTQAGLTPGETQHLDDEVSLVEWTPRPQANSPTARLGRASDRRRRGCVRKGMPFAVKGAMEGPMTPEPAARTATLSALLPLIRYARRHLGRAIGALAALTVSSAATLTVPFALRRMIDFGFSKDSGGAIDIYFLMVAALVVVIALAAATRYYLVTTLGERVVADLRRDVFAHLTSLDASFYDRARIGELISRLTADTTQIKAAFGSSASTALRNLFMFIGSTALMIYTARSCQRWRSSPFQ